jgi:hypothetical protein
MSHEPLPVACVAVAEQQSVAGHEFPLVLGNEDSGALFGDVLQWVRQSRDLLLEKCHLHGTVLFTGFPLHGPDEFDQFVSAFELPNFPYEQSLSNAVRVNYTPRVFSANEAPADVTIYLHHEMAQTPIFPGKLFFFCQQPADEGGATPLCRSDLLLDKMRENCPEFVQQCEEKGLQYSNVMPSENDATSGMGRNWQSTFGASNQAEAEQRMSQLGYSWQWLPDGCLRATTPVLPAVREVSPGRKVFFNQLIAAFQGWKDERNDPSKSITFGDGSRLDRDTVLQVAALAESLTFNVPWRAGDVALVDNFLVMHGRRTFRGTRKVLASLIEAQRHEATSN